MFVILNVKESGRKKIHKGKTVDKVHEYFTGGGEKFYVIDVLDSERGVDWGEVSRFVGRYGKAVLLDRRYALPENTTMRRFEPDKFKNILLFNTLSAILRQLYLYGMRMKCYINDPRGIYSFLLPGIVRFACETFVITNCAFRYDAEVQSLYSHYGASVTVSDKADITDRGAVIIDTDGSFKYGGIGVLFSVNDRGITPLYADGFNDIKSLCPSYIDENDFLGAVYERNHEKRLENALCRLFADGEETVSASELTERIMNIKTENCDSTKSIIFYLT